MNSKLKGLLSGAVISALVIGSVAFAEEGAAPANADQKMSGDKNGCSGKNGCDHGDTHHHKKHKKHHKNHAKHQKKADAAPASADETKAE